MKKRSIGKMLLLTIITLGIYRLYWFVKTRSEMKKIANVDIPSPLLFLIPMLGYIGAIVLVITSSNGQPASVALTLLMYVLFLGGFLFTALWLWKYSKAVEVITKEKLSFALSLIVLLAVPDGIDILIIQDYFNKINVVPTHLPKSPTPVS